ncbi:MAG: TonB-dependent siderophore receptor [Pseudomonadota bacterium]
MSKKTLFSSSALACAGLGAALSTLCVASASAQEQIESSKEYETIIIQGIARSFLPKETSSVARFDIPLTDTPASVSVLTEDLLELANIKDVGDALSLVSGVSYGERNFSQPQYNYRGFEGGVEGSINVDNYRSSNYFLPDKSLVERIDVIKGPVAVNYGEIQPGGTINLVTKRPNADGGTRIKLEAGKWDKYRVEFDSTGSLDQEGNFLYRLIAAYEQAENFVDFVEDEVMAVGGSFDWNTTDKLSFSGKAIWQTRDAVFDVGGTTEVTLTGDPNEPFTYGFPNASRSTYYGQPWNKTEADFANYGLKASYVLTDRITVNAIYDYQEVDRYNLFAQINGPILAGGDGSVTQRRREDREGLTEIENYEVNLVGDFDFLDQQHVFYVGVQHNEAASDDLNRLPRNITPFNIFSPVYEDKGATFRGDAVIEDYGVTDIESTSIAAQAYLNLTNRFSLLLGGRYSDQESETRIFECDLGGGVTGPCADTSFTTNDLVLAATDGVFIGEGDNFSPTVGLVYALNDNINTYFNYSQSFEVQSAQDRSLNPSEGEQFEIGVKALLFGGQLSITSAIYEITKTNIATEDINGDTLLTGEQRSRGFEIDVVGEVFDGLNIIAQYGYVDAEITEDEDPDNIGLKPPRTPDHSGSVFATYEIQGGQFQGLGFGAGYRYVGEREATLTNVFTQDSYDLLDLQVFYNGFENVELLASVSNVWDEEYYNVTFNGSPNGVRPGEPVAWRLSAAYRF